MSDALALILPFVSVLLGGGITYVVNVWQRRYEKVDEVFRAAIEAVVVAQASAEFIGGYDAGEGLLGEDLAAVNSQLARESRIAFAHAVADARAAVARASVYEPRLRPFLDRWRPTKAVYEDAESIIDVLRERIGSRRPSRSRKP